LKEQQWGERGELIVSFSNGQNREVEEMAEELPLGGVEMGIYTHRPDWYGYGRHCRPAQTGRMDLQPGRPVLVWSGCLDLRS
jgi:hypothetical protein